MAFRLWVWVLIIGLCILCDTRCTSSISVKAAKQVANNERATELVDAYVPHGSDRDFIKKALQASSATIQDQASALEVAEQKANKAESDARTWRLVKGSAFGAVILLGLWWVKRKV